jgi:hypothetical protein
MYTSFVPSSKLRFAALSGAVALVLIAGSAQAQITQSGERKNINRLGHTDLQGRPSYQPNVIQYPDGRWILFVGTHNNTPVPQPGCSATTLPNPLNGNACESNGTIIIDVTDPNNPVEKVHIPVPVAGGQAQMARMCLGSQLPNGTPGHVYLMRNIQGSTASGYEVWDVTNINAPAGQPGGPFLASNLLNIRSTHKVWWECKSGIAYMPGSKDATQQSGPLWRQSQAMLVYDWSNPNAAPSYIRTFGLPGGEPTATGAVPNSLHGAISAFEHPKAAQSLTRGATASDVIGNRIYAAWGVGDDGVMTIIDRTKLLDQAHGGTWVPATPNSRDSPTQAELVGGFVGGVFVNNSPTVGYMTMSPDQGGHTSMPIFGVQPPSFAKFDEFATRDIMVLTSEATTDGENARCPAAPHPAFLVDITIENSMTAPPGTRVEHDAYQGPMVLSTMWIQPQFGERYPRGNYCARGARFGVHSSEENFNSPFYGKLTSLAYFNGGVRVWDIREPYSPTQVAFYVPEANAHTDPAGMMSNNTEVDNRGLIYVVDRNGAGMDILQLFGCAQQIITSGGSCPPIQ